MIYLILIVYQIIIISVKPYEENKDNYFALFNEILVSLYALSFIGLTDITYSIEAKNVVGMIQLSIIFLYIVTNLVVFILQISLNILKRKKRH